MAQDDWDRAYRVELMRAIRELEMLRFADAWQTIGMAMECVLNSPYWAPTLARMMYCLDLKITFDHELNFPSQPK